MSAKPCFIGFTDIFTIGRYFTFLLINSHVLPLESGEFLRYQTYHPVTQDMWRDVRQYVLMALVVLLDKISKRRSIISTCHGIALLIEKYKIKEG